LEIPQDRYVLVAAASPEPFGDERTLIAQTDVDVMPVVWGSVTASIKLFTLEHRIGDLTTYALAELQQTVFEHRAPQHWPNISNILDDRVLERSQLQDSLLQLTQAEWAPQSTGHSLADQATAAGVEVVDVRKALNIPPGDARNLLMGHRSLRPNEFAPLTRLLGASPEDATSYDDQLVRDLELPQFRARLERRAAVRGMTDPIALRRQFAEELMPVAARMRYQSQRDWKSVISDLLDAY
jgi:hypothetical protein